MFTDKSGHKRFYTPYEMVANDVTSNRGSLSKILPVLHEVGVWNPNFLYFTNEISRVMAQYIHVAMAIWSKSDGMIIDLLQIFHNNRNHWNTDIIDVCRMVCGSIANLTLYHK